jgi:hypothetical protein
VIPGSSIGSNHHQLHLSKFRTCFLKTGQREDVPVYSQLHSEFPEYISSVRLVHVLYTYMCPTVFIFVIFKFFYLTKFWCESDSRMKYTIKFAFPIIHALKSVIPVHFLHFFHWPVFKVGVHQGSCHPEKSVETTPKSMAHLRTR